MKSLKYVIIYLLIVQLCFYYLVPLEFVYGYRMDYHLVKDNINNIDTILEKIKLEIEKNKLKNYVIILGDSVAFSGPGGSKESLGFYLQRIAEEKLGNNAPRIYNLAMPAMQTGDIYTMLLKLDEYGISTDNLILNIIYAGFVKRNPDPPIVFWLKEDLKELDENSFSDVYANLKANNYKDEKKIFEEFKEILAEDVLTKFSVYKYKDFLKKALQNNIKKKNDALGDARPWFEKEGLREFLEQPEYQKGFSPEPFDMSKNNPQIYFLDKIIEHQKNKNTLIFLAGTNEALMQKEISQKGYQENLQRINKYFADKNTVKFLNLQGKINDTYFSDHIHLTGEGYRKLAEIIYENMFTKVGI